MACDQPLMDQDQWLATLLNGATVSRDGTTLTLVNGDVTLTLTDEATANPDASLQDTVWTLDGISDANAASSVPAGGTATISAVPRPPESLHPGALGAPSPKGDHWLYP